jgi:putative methyltransferase (TIGR04325 family)
MWGDSKGGQHQDMDFRQLFRDLLPPAFYRFLSAHYPGAATLKGPYDSWPEAVKHSGGYDSAAIFDKVEAAAREVLAGNAAYERDSVLFSEPEYNYPLLALLLRAATEHHGKLSLLDFGGSLGSTYFQNRTFLSSLDSLEWNIVEQEKFVRLGRQHFENEELHFYDSIKDSLRVRHPNVILLCSVLQYLEHPYQLLQQIQDAGAPYIFIERTPFSIADMESVVVQKVPEKIYKASYPAWIFEYGKMIKVLSKEYTPIITIESPEGLVGSGRNAVCYKTILLKRKSNP